MKDLRLENAIAYRDALLKKLEFTNAFIRGHEYFEKERIKTGMPANVLVNGDASTQEKRKYTNDSGVTNKLGGKAVSYSDADIEHIRTRFKELVINGGWSCDRADKVIGRELLPPRSAIAIQQVRSLNGIVTRIVTVNPRDSGKHVIWNDKKKKS